MNSLASAARTALVGSFFLAGVSTLGDFVWSRWIPSHQMVFGVAHGAILCLCIGLFLGRLASRPGAIVRGALGELVVGLVASLGFYGLYPVLRSTTMFVCWMLLWILTGLLNRSIRGSRESTLRTLARGGSAALLSGASFYAISGIWLDPDPGGPDYLFHFASWTVAFFPGLLPLVCCQNQCENHG